MSKASTVHLGRHEIGRFSFFLVSLLMMIGLRPLLDEWIGGLFWGDVSTDIFFACALMSGLHAINEQPQQLRISLLLVVAIIILSVLHYNIQNSIIDNTKLILSLIFLVQMLIMILTHIQKQNDVTIDLIMAAASAYILLGMVWAYAYYFLESFHLHSFSTNESLYDDLGAFNYNSFTTLTTVGYGDIFPATKAARALSILEAITGQLYLAIMISRLVGLHASQARTRYEN